MDHLLWFRMLDELKHRWSSTQKQQSSETEISMGVPTHLIFLVLHRHYTPLWMNSSEMFSKDRFILFIWEKTSDEWKQDTTSVKKQSTTSHIVVPALSCEVFHVSRLNKTARLLDEIVHAFSDHHLVHSTAHIFDNECIVAILDDVRRCWIHAPIRSQASDEQYFTDR